MYRCLPRMNSSRLSHIQQLWAELREQIRSLQSSIWENTTLASNAWHRSSFEAITEMLSRMTHGDGDRSAETPTDDSNTFGTRLTRPQTESLHTTSSSQSNSAFTSNSSLCEGSLFRRTPGPSALGHNSSSSQSHPFSTNHFEISSATTSSPSLFHTNSPTVRSNSSAIRTAARTNLRGNVNRSCHRPNQTQRLLNLRHPNSLVRRLGTTAGVLRASRTSSCRSTVSSSACNNAESNEQSAQPSNIGPLFVHGRHLARESYDSCQPEVSRTSRYESDLLPTRTSLERYKPAFINM